VLVLGIVATVLLVVSLVFVVLLFALGGSLFMSSGS
jgi:hypothetical protein